MFRQLIACGVIAAAVSPSLAALVGAGDIAFTGFNADGQDDIAFAVLKPVSTGEVIYFSDNEWNGSAIGSGGAFNTGESYTSWTATSDLAAGSIVVINNLSNGTPAMVVNTGTAAPVTVSLSANRGLSTTADVVYAYLASAATPDVPTAFLGAITSGTGTEAEIGGTGLAFGTTAIQLSNSSDGAVYNGSRSDQSTFGAYAGPVNTVANWTDVANGDGTTLLPISTTAFSVPEPASLALFGLAGLVGLRRRR